MFALHLRGLCSLAQVAAPGAIADLERAATLANRAPFYLGLLGLCYGEFGMRDEALGLIAELDRQARTPTCPPSATSSSTRVSASARRRWSYQEKAYVDGASPFNYLTPSVRELYALDPHHQKRLEQMRLIL